MRRNESSVDKDLMTTDGRGRGFVLVSDHSSDLGLDWMVASSAPGFEPVLTR